MQFKLKGSTQILFILLGSILILFIAWPLMKTVISSSPAQILETIGDSEVQQSILLTFYSAFLATVIAFVCGIPLAYLLARADFPGKKLIQGIIDVPVVVPHSAVGIALLLVFGRRTFLGKLFGLIGIKFVSDIPGIVIAMLFVSVPFLVNSAREGFEAVDPRLECVSRTLGASAWQTFWKISFPLAWNNILSGAIMMWARGISEFGAVVMLAYNPMVAPVLLFQRFESYGLNASLPIATLMILICLITFTALRLVGKRKEVDA